LSENTHLSAELNRILSDRGRLSVEHKYKDTDFIDNLKLQLKIVVDEKNQAIKLWQNATAMVEQLEGELRVYHENTEGLIPKSQLIQASGGCVFFSLNILTGLVVETVIRG
jgi:hypothetical protein